MKLNQKQIYAAIIAVVVIVAGIVFYKESRGSHEALVVSTDRSGQNQGILSIDPSYTGNATIKVVSQGTSSTTAKNGTSIVVGPNTPSGIAIPDLSRPIIVIQNIGGAESTATSTETKIISGYVAILKKDPSQMETWLALAQQRELIGDYDGASQIFVYLTRVAPTNSVAFLDLGDLYANYIKNYSQAEAYYLKAIPLDTVDDMAYQGLFQLYKYSYKQNTSAATDILIQGINKNPNDVNLMTTLANYYAGKGDKSDARAYYEKALAVANSMSNQDMIQSIQQSLSELN